MSYARDAEAIKANSKAYAAYRDKVKYGTLRDEADSDAISALKSGTTTTDGKRRGGFDQGGHVIGSEADELYYRMNKKGSISMNDIKDITSFGGRADKDGIVQIKNGADRKVSNGNLFRSVQDMQETGDYKFDDDVISWAKKQREADDARRAPELARKAAKRKAQEARRAKAKTARPANKSSDSNLNQQQNADQSQNQQNSAADEQAKAREAAEKKAKAKAAADAFKKRTNETITKFAQNRKNREAAKFNTKSFQEVINNSSNQARNALPKKYDYKSNAQDSGAEKWNYQ